ncbi:hypothetical protein [Mangrovibacterium lignilyticum]|uniref:hypothetical protein n=1 Tax=Mangrovibacterium lignilyticum TaxID=2668052 RepID=UPI0013D26AA6|nr:hypothetical protein [Mangrovibacterium lignilyticum]
MTQVESFLNDLNNSAKQLDDSDQSVGQKTSNETITRFTESTQKTLIQLQSYIDERKLDQFYKEIEELKFMIEYSDELNKNWLFIRAYSGALRFLLKDISVINAKDVFVYYEVRYGGRRILRNENWFEQIRWEFLDELQTANDQVKLSQFVSKRVKKLNDCFQVYKSELLLFIQSLQKL